MNAIFHSIQFNFRSFLWSAAILFCTYIMACIILPYTSWRWDIDFLLTKQHIIHLDYYRVAFYAHIFSSLLVLLAGAVLFSKFIIKEYPVLHSWAGKFYVGLLLIFSAPSGFVMGFYANGGWLAQLSFFILTPLWWWFTYKGYVTARQRNFKAHKIWMMRSYALALSAISLRVYQMLLGSFFMIDPVVQYILVSWVSWMGNLAFAEWWLIKNHGFLWKAWWQSGKPRYFAPISFNHADQTDQKSHQVPTADVVGILHGRR